MLGGNLKNVKGALVSGVDSQLVQRPGLFAPASASVLPLWTAINGRFILCPSIPVRRGSRLGIGSYNDPRLGARRAWAAARRTILPIVLI